MAFRETLKVERKSKKQGKERRKKKDLEVGEVEWRRPRGGGGGGGGCGCKTNDPGDEMTTTLCRKKPRPALLTSAQWPLSLPRAPRGSKFTNTESIRAGGAKGGRTGTVDEVRVGEGGGLQGGQECEEGREKEREERKGR